jgi:hypothetical protein
VAGAGRKNGQAFGIATLVRWLTTWWQSFQIEKSSPTQMP